MHNTARPTSEMTTLMTPTKRIRSEKKLKTSSRIAILRPSLSPNLVVEA